MEIELLTAVLSCIALAITFLYRYITANFKFFEKQGISGPKPSFPFGTWKGAWKKDLGENDLSNVNQYGKVFGTFDGRTPNLVIAEPELIKKILDDDSSKFQSYRAFRVKQSILQKSLLNIEGRASKELKKIFNNTLSNGKIKKLLPRVHQTAETLTQGILKSTGEEKSINITDLVSSYINDTIAFSIYGLDLNADEAVQRRFHNALNKVFVVDNPDSLLSVTPFIFESLGSLENFILRPSAAGYLTGLTNLVIEEREKTSEIKSEGRALDFIDLLLAASEEEKKALAKEKGIEEEAVEQLLTKDELITSCIEVILAVGRAAKSTLALSLQVLVQFPSIQEKLNKELSKQLSKFGEISYEFIRDFEYLDMFVGEILRLYPIEYRLERKCTEEVIWGETRITPGTLVSVPLYAVHRLPEFYPDPEKFDPERFTAENSEKRNHYTYLPFGQAGTNSTNIGIQLSVLYIKLALSHLINSLKFSKVSEESEVTPGFVKGVTGVPIPTAIVLKAEKREY